MWLCKCLDFGIAGEDSVPLSAEKAHTRKGSFLTQDKTDQLRLQGEVAWGAKWSA